MYTTKGRRQKDKCNKRKMLSLNLWIPSKSPFVLFYYSVLLRIEPRALHMVGCTSELHHVAQEPVFDI